MLSNVLISSKVQSKKISSSSENEKTFRELAKRSSKSATKSSSSLTSKLKTQIQTLTQTKNKNKSKIQFKLKNQTANTFMARQTIPLNFQYITAAVSFVMEIVAQLNIPVISELAQKALAAKQWGQACVNGIKDFLPFLKNDGSNKKDSDYVAQKFKLQKEYKDFLAEVRNIYVFYNGKDENYENVLAMTDVRQICNINKINAAKTDINARIFNSFQTMMNLPQHMMMTKAMYSQNTKQDKEVSQNISNVWSTLNKKITDDVLKNFEHINSTSAQRKEQAKQALISYGTSKDLGAVVCDVKKDELNDFNRYLCYTYYGLDYFKTNAAEKAAKTKTDYKEITEKFDALYESSIVEAEIKLTVATQMDCDLAIPEERSAITNILTVVKKLIDVIKNARNFIEGCLLPAYNYAKEMVEERNALELQKINEEIHRAKQVALAKEKAAAPAETILDTIPAGEGNNPTNAKPELTEFVKIMKDTTTVYAIDPKEVFRLDQINVQHVSILNEDIKYDLSADNPTQSANADMQNCKAKVKKVGDFMKHVGATFIEEAKNEAIDMIEKEQQEFIKSPVKYMKKVTKESAKFAINPTKYSAKVIVSFGAKTAVRTTFTLAHEQKEHVIDKNFRNEHPYISAAVDDCWELAEQKEQKLKDLAGKGAINLIKSRFKEISLNKNKNSRRTKTKTLTKAQVKTKAYASERINWYITNGIRGIISAKLTLHKYNYDLTVNQQLAVDIGRKVVDEFVPYVKKFACGFVVKIITDFFGPGAFKYLLKVQQIMGIVKDVYSAYNQVDVVEKWGLYGKSIGKGIKLFMGDGSVGGSVKSLCGRRLKKFRK